MSDFDLHLWFADDELKVCRVCGAQAAVHATGSGAFVCFECGEIRFPNDESEAKEGERPRG